MSLHRRNSVWWVRFTTPGGERTRRSTGTASKEQAREYHDRLKAEIWKTQQLAWIIHEPTAADADESMDGRGRAMQEQLPRCARAAIHGGQMQELGQRRERLPRRP